MLLLSALIITSGLGPTTARAGGWWSYIQLRGHHLGVGETLTVRSEVSFRSLRDAGHARRTDYYAYLVRGIDGEGLQWAMSRPEPKHWWAPPEAMTLVGDVTVSRWDSNLALSTLRLSIPEMPLGGYHLMLCDKGCRNPLGDLIPFRVEVVNDALTAQTARRLQQTTERTSLAIARVRKDLRQSGKKIRVARANAGETAEGVAALRKRLASLDTEPPSTPWPAYLAWFVAGLGIASAVVRGRHRTALPLAETPVEHIPDDACELAASSSQP